MYMCRCRREGGGGSGGVREDGFGFWVLGVKFFPPPERRVAWPGYRMADDADASEDAHEAPYMGGLKFNPTNY